MSWPVEYRRKVRFSDSDAQGIVFNANYLVYWDDTITDYFDALGLPWDVFADRGYEIVLAHAEINYRSAARIGDTLVTGARVERIGNTSVTFAMQTRTADPDQRPVVDGRLVQVVVGTDLQPAPVPGFLRTAIDRLQNRV